VKWTGFALYVLLERLRAYIKLSSDEKAEKNNEILFKSNILFEVLEKALYFDRSGDSFRKYKYLQEFNFSSGIKMIDKTVVKYSASLFMPELYQYYKNLLQMPDKDIA
jgi:hypothetical protein